jgi:hypothetical protein
MRRTLSTYVFHYNHVPLVAKQLDCPLRDYFCQQIMMLFGHPGCSGNLIIYLISHHGCGHGVTMAPHFESGHHVFKDLFLVNYG